MNTFTTCSLHIGLNHDSTGESTFFLLHGCDTRIPCEATLSLPVPHIKLILMSIRHGLSAAWKLARNEVQRSQKKQKRHYDRHAKQRDFQVGYKVMVYMPYKHIGKNRKLSRPYFGPYWVMEVHPNGVTVRPVHCLKDNYIWVNLDRVTLCVLWSYPMRHP